MSDANYTKLTYVQEATYGITPDPANFKGIRFTGESLAHAKETVTSNELRNDRQRSDLVEVGAMAQGGVNFELSRDEFLPFWLAGLGAEDWTTINVTTTATASRLAQTLVGSGGAFANIPAGGFVKVAGLSNAASNGIKRILLKSEDGNTLTFAPGSFAEAQVGASVTITGRDARNGIEKTHFTFERSILAPDEQEYFQAYTGMSVEDIGLQIASKAIVTGTVNFMGKVGKPSLETLNNAGTPTKASAELTFGATDPSDGNKIVIGSRSYTLKTALTGADDEILINATPATQATSAANAINADAASFGTTHTVRTPHSVVTAAAAAAVVTVTARRAGTAANAVPTTTTGSTGSVDWNHATLEGGVNPTATIASTTNPVLNGTSNVGYIFQGNTMAVTRFKSINLTLKNNLRAKDALGEKGAFELGWGTIDVTGTLEAYFRNNDLYKSIVDHDYTALAFVLTGADGKSIGFTFPYINFGAGDPNATGINTDIMISPDWTAIRHPVLGCTAIISLLD